jgi:hypothetical protein
MRRMLTLFLVALMLVAAADDALAKKAKRKAKKKKKGKATITVPVDVAVGPTANWFTGPIGDDQFFHYGLKFDVGAIIDQKTIQANKHRIPKKYRGMAGKMKEFVYRPFWWLPDSLLISPDMGHGQMYGITFRPIGLGLSLINNNFMKFSLSAGAVLTYAWMANDTWVSEHGYEADSMHFLRPGVDAKAEVLLKLSKGFLLSFGWDSYFYVPQRIGAGPFDELGENVLEESAWHNGQAFVLLHFRFPYTTKF